MMSLQSLCVDQIRNYLVLQSFPFHQLTKLRDYELFWESIDAIFKPFSNHTTQDDAVSLSNLNNNDKKKLFSVNILLGMLHRQSESMQNCNLHSLHLTDSFDLSTESVSIDWLFTSCLPFIFPHLCDLKVTNLRVCQLSDYSLAVISTCYATSLVDLNLSGCDGVSIDGINKTLVNIKTLRRLYLRNCGIHFTDWPLPQAFDDIDVGGNLFSAQDIHNVLKGITSTSATTLLYLGMNIDRHSLRSWLCRPGTSSNTVSKKIQRTNSHYKDLSKDFTFDTQLLSSFHKLQGLDIRGWTLKETSKNNSKPETSWSCELCTSIHSNARATECETCLTPRSCINESELSPTFLSFPQLTSIDLSYSLDITNSFVNIHRYSSIINYFRQIYDYSTNSDDSSSSDGGSGSSSSSSSSSNGGGSGTIKTNEISDFCVDDDVDFRSGVLSAIALQSGILSLSLVRRAITIADLNLIVYANYASSLIFLDLSHNFFSEADKDGSLRWSFANFAALEVLILRNCSLRVTQDLVDLYSDFEPIDADSPPSSYTFTLFPRNLRLLDISDNANLLESRFDDEELTSSVLARAIRPLKCLEALFINSSLADSAYLKDMLLDKGDLKVLDISGVDLSVLEFNEIFSSGDSPKLTYLGLERCRLLAASMHLIEPGILPSLKDIKAGEIKSSLLSILTGELVEADVDRLITSRSKSNKFEGMMTEDDFFSSARSPRNKSKTKKGSKPSGQSKIGKEKEKEKSSMIGEESEKSAERILAPLGGPEEGQAAYKNYFNTGKISLEKLSLLRYNNRGVANYQDVQIISLSSSITETAESTVAVSESNADSEISVTGLKSVVDASPSESIQFSIQTAEQTTDEVLSRDQIITLRNHLVGNFSPPTLKFSY